MLQSVCVVHRSQRSEGKSLQGEKQRFVFVICLYFRKKTTKIAGLSNRSYRSFIKKEFSLFYVP